MLVSFENLLQRNANSGTAVGAFTCYDLETARAVLAAAAERGAGVVLLVSRESFAAPGGDQLLAGVRAAAEHAPAGPSRPSSATWPVGRTSRSRPRPAA